MWKVWSDILRREQMAWSQSTRTIRIFGLSAGWRVVVPVPVVVVNADDGDVEDEDEDEDGEVMLLLLLLLLLATFEGETAVKEERFSFSSK